MNIDNLSKQISDDIEAYRLFIQSEYPEGSNSDITSGDLAEFGKQTNYVLNSFRDNIIKYLEEK